MTLQQLKYFRVMAEILHYTQAAKMLYISQSSLSYSLSELEKELGAPLFDKQGKKTVLTEYGKELLPFATNALESIEEGVRRIERMRMPSSVIGLGYIYSLSFDFLPRILSNFFFHVGHGEISFNFFQGLSPVILEKLKRGELDIALSVATDDPSICSEPIYDQSLYLVVPKGHHLAEKGKITIQDLRKETFVSINANSSLRQHLDRLFEDLHISPHISFEAEECNAMASFVSARFGIAIMPDIPALNAYHVDIIPMDDPHFRRQINVLWVKDRPLSPAATRFKEFLVKFAKKPDLCEQDIHRLESKRLSEIPPLPDIVKTGS